MAKKRPGKRKGSKPPPKCKAILLCDQIIVDAMTGKASIIGIFDGFKLPKVPYFSREYMVYLQLIEGIGEYTIVIEIHDLRDGLVLARAPVIGVKWKDRLTRMNLVIPVPPIPLRHAGEYDLVVFANDQEIDRQRFTATLEPEKDAPEDDSSSASSED